MSSTATVDHRHAVIEDDREDSSSSPAAENEITRRDDTTAKELESCFEVDLVEATTKDPFLQHKKDGKTYVEVEPDTEFYVLVRKSKKLPIDDEICIDVFVDDQSLGWAISFNDRKSHMFGLCHFDGNNYFKNALKFRKRHQRNEEQKRNVQQPRVTAQVLREYLMGKVEAKIFEYKGTGGPASQSSTDFVCSEATEEESRIPVLDEKKVVAEVGTKKEETSCCSTANVGRQLGSIELNYCTVKGLMAVGVVPRYTHGNRNTSTMVDNERKRSGSVMVTPTKRFTKRIISQFDDEEEVEKTVTYDFYDLTQFPSSDDDDNINNDDDDDDDDDHDGKIKERVSSNAPTSVPASEAASISEVSHSAQRNLFHGMDEI